MFVLQFLKPLLLPLRIHQPRRITRHQVHFEVQETSATIEAAKALAKGLAAEIAAFKAAIDPDN